MNSWEGRTDKEWIGTDGSAREDTEHMMQSQTEGNVTAPRDFCKDAIFESMTRKSWTPLHMHIFLQEKWGLAEGVAETNLWAPGFLPTEFNNYHFWCIYVYV